MNKRQEIRKGIEEYTECPAALWAYLHSKDVVIKVERDSYYTQIPMEKVPLSGDNAYIVTEEIEKAGYVAIEPLLETT